MERLRRRRRVAKWAGLIVSPLIVVLWGASLPWEFVYNATEKRGGFALQLYEGCLCLGTNPIRGWSETEAGWHVTKREPVTVRWGWSCHRASDGHLPVLMPLWIPFLLVAVSTAFLYWRDGYRIGAWAAGIGFVLVGLFWVTSLTHEAAWHDHTTSISISRGAVRIEILPAGALKDHGEPWHIARLTYKAPLAWLPSYRRGYLLPSVINGIEVSWQTIFPTTAIIPLWPVGMACLAVVIIPMLWRRRHKPGHCRTCNYDLTGNTSGVCPECGQVRV